MNTHKKNVYYIQISLLALICLLIGSYFSLTNLNRKEEWLKHTDSVLLHLSKIQFSAAESGMFARSFMITGEENSIGLGLKATRETLKEFNIVKRLTSDNASVVPLLDSISSYIFKRINYSKELVERRKNGGLLYAIQLQQNGEGKINVEKCNYFIHLVEQSEYKLMKKRMLKLEEAKLIMVVSIGLTVSFLFIMIASTINTFKKETAKRRKLLKTLLANEERNKIAEKLAHLGTWNIDVNNYRISGSEEMYRIWGISKGEVSLHQFLKQVHPNDSLYVKKYLNAIVKGINGPNLSCRLVVAGNLKYITIGVTVIREQDVLTSIYGYAQDITEKTNAELMRQDTSRELTLLINRIGEVVFSRDVINDRFILISDTCEFLYKYTPDEFIAEPDLWISVIHPDDRHVLSEGNIFLMKGLQSTQQYRIIRKDQTVKWVENTLVPTMNSSGDLVRIDGVVRDINDKKLAQIERERIIIELTQRNTTMEEFNYIISHNFRLPVANLLGLTQLIDAKECNEEQLPIIEQIQSSAKELDSILKDLNTIMQVRQQVNEKKQIVSLTELTAKVKRNLRLENIKEIVHIETNFLQIDRLYSIQNYLYSVFYNLLLNSVNYRKEGATAEISIESSIVNDQLRIVFSDNGKGIDLIINGKSMFGLFRRFDNSVEGKGMGLFLVKTQIETLGGTIKVESALNEGTRFYIVLPMANLPDKITCF
jgi:signal transduction histidine kinase/CHASE3 domain sensor protein